MPDGIWAIADVHQAKVEIWGDMMSFESRGMKRSTRSLAKAGLGALLALLLTSACQTTGSSRTAERVPDRPAVDDAISLPGADLGTGTNLSVPHMEDEEPIRVALLLPLSHSQDDAKTVAQALLNAAELALFEIKNANVMLMPKDTGGTPFGAEQATIKAIDEGADLILGPLFADSVRTAADIARGARVPMVAFSTDRTVAGDGVYLLSFLPEQEVKRVVDFAVSEGFYSFAGLIPQSAYGYRVQSAYEYSIQRKGGYITQMQTYPRIADEMFAPARIVAEYDVRRSALKSRNSAAKSDPQDATMVYDEVTDTLIPAPVEENVMPASRETWGGVSYQAVLLPEGGTLLRSLAPLLPYFDVDPRKIKFLGTGLWDDETLGKEPSLVGGWFAAPSPQMREAFGGRYQAAYGVQPPRIASLGFDAVALAASLAALPEKNRFDDETIGNPNGFAGIDGIFRFLPDGSSERGLAVIQVNPDGLEVISPAPTTFQRIEIMPEFDESEFREFEERERRQEFEGVGTDQYRDGPS